MRFRLPVLALAAVLSAACGPAVDLGRAFELADVSSGWYDNGVRDGKNHLVPSVTFRLHNRGEAAVAGVQLTVAFWRDGDDGEQDSLQVRGIGGEALPAGSSTDPIVVRATVGYTLEGARADLFDHGMFKDVTARVFAKRSGKIVQLGEVRIERRLLPRQPSGTPLP